MVDALVLGNHGQQVHWCAASGTILLFSYVITESAERWGDYSFIPG